jgi:hypothetical protein
LLVAPFLQLWKKWGMYDVYFYFYIHVLTFALSVPADQVDAIGHWEGNTRHEVYAAKIPKAVSVTLQMLYL